MEDRIVSLEYLSWSVSSTAYAIDSPLSSMLQALCTSRSSFIVDQQMSSDHRRLVTRFER